MDFTFDLRVMDLKTYDVVLGLKWLKSIKNAFWDYETLSMYFWHEGALRKLQAIPPNEGHLARPGRFLVDSNNQNFLLHFR